MTENKYWRCYVRLMERARGRERAAGMERHHIVPRSLGGSNAKGNLVFLTYREHFLAHWLLVKCTDGADRRRMNFALACMLRSHSGHHRTATARQYEIAKLAVQGIHLGNCYAKGNKANAGRKLSESTRRKMSVASSNQSEAQRAASSARLKGVRLALGHKHGPDVIAKFSLYHSNRSPEHQAKLTASLLGNKRSLGHCASSETRKKLSEALLGHAVSAETREKLRAAWVLRKARSGVASDA